MKPRPAQCEARCRAGLRPLGAAWARRTRERAVVLVVSLLMLSVVTFIAIAFLAVSNRERASVSVAASRIEAKLVAEAMLARAQGDLLAHMIASTNRYDYGLRVSTNLIARWGFTNGSPDPMNVAYVDQNNQPLDGNGTYPAQLQMLANLQYDARPPVFIRTNNIGTTNDFDFRFYLDFNRNGMHDTNGWSEEWAGNGIQLGQKHLVGDPEWIGFLEHPGQPHGPTNRFIGRGAFLVLPMGKSLDLNFIHNQAKIVGSPSAQSSDNNLNLFFRNQGVGSWEINLSAFLVDLNTNMWRPPNGGGLSSGSGYFYNTATGRVQNAASVGVAFNDARTLVNYRYENNYLRLAPMLNSYSLNKTPNIPALNFFPSNSPNDRVIRDTYVDLYSDGPLMLGPGWLEPDPRPPQSPMNLNDPFVDGWPGSFSFSTANLTPYYDIQELFTDLPPVQEPAYPASRRAYANVPQALRTLGRTNYLPGLPTSTTSTYDRYTVYRMLDQMGTYGFDVGGAPARMDINFDNLTNGLSGMRFWEPLRFFTNAAHRLLRLYYPTNNNPDAFDASDPVTGQPAGNPNGTYGTNGLSLIGTNAVTGWTNFQIYPKNLYTPNAHRLLQLAANIYDATRSHGTNQPDGTILPTVPSVFRPIFYRVQDTVGQWTVSIAGYEQVTETNLVDELFFIKNAWYELDDLATNGLSSRGGIQDSDGIIRNINVHGIPVIVGAKKYLPNFNEFAMQTWVTAARRLELYKQNAGQTNPTGTNVAMTFSVSNVLGMEIFNSYARAYPRPLEIRATNFCRWAITNSTGGVVNAGSGSFVANLAQRLTRISSRSSPLVYNNNRTIPANELMGGAFLSNSVTIPVLPESAYDSTTLSLTAWPPTTNAASSTLFKPISPEAMASDLVLVITNSVQCLIVDANPNGGSTPYRVIDCVNLDNMVSVVHIGDMVSGETIPQPTDRSTGRGSLIHRTNLWSTNLWQGSTVVTEGVFRQMQASLNTNYTSVGWQWNDYNLASGLDKLREINKFRSFVDPTLIQLEPPQTHVTPKPDQLSVQAPLTIAVRKVINFSWQANDPLVHYTMADLNPDTLPVTSNSVPFTAVTDPKSQGFNVGTTNSRYQPWGRQGGLGAFGGYSNVFNFAIKDPGVVGPDAWDFPANASSDPNVNPGLATNYFANVGWLGRVHRGTPWQTVYLKSGYFKDPNAPNPGSIRSTPLLGANNQPVLDTNGVPVTNFNYLIPPRAWRRWAGSEESHPTNDWRLFNIFTATYGASAERSLLSVNQTNLAAWSAVLGGVMVLSNNQYSAQAGTLRTFSDLPIEPASAPLLDMVRAINEYRATNFLGGVFTNAGNILGVPELTVYSPYLNEKEPVYVPRQESDLNNGSQIAYGLTDSAYERIPQQVMSLLQIEPSPRFVIYAYGQALRPADRSVIVDPTVLIRRPDDSVGESARGMCTNYQITAEVALRAVIRVDGMPNGVGPHAPINSNSPPRIVVENFKLLPAIEY